MITHIYNIACIYLFVYTPKPRLRPAVLTAVPALEQRSEGDNGL